MSQWVASWSWGRATGLPCSVLVGEVWEQVAADMRRPRLEGPTSKSSGSGEPRWRSAQDPTTEIAAACADPVLLRVGCHRYWRLEQASVTGIPGTPAAVTWGLRLEMVGLLFRGRALSYTLKRTFLLSRLLTTRGYQISHDSVRCAGSPARRFVPAQERILWNGTSLPVSS